MATFEDAKQVKRRHSDQLLKKPGVCGIDVQTDSQGHGLIFIHIDANNNTVESELPPTLEGVPVKVLRTGPFEKQS
jgi:hypothetical protein